MYRNGLFILRLVTPCSSKTQNNLLSPEYLR